MLLLGSATAATGYTNYETAFIADAQSPLHGTRVDDLDFRDGKVFLKSSPTRAERYTAVLKRHGS
jgi:hypothetical protein